eukprot:51777-Rhodomonas_salina.4
MGLIWPAHLLPGVSAHALEHRLDLSRRRTQPRNAATISDKSAKWCRTFDRSEQNADAHVNLASQDSERARERVRKKLRREERKGRRGMVGEDESGRRRERKKGGREQRDGTVE